MTELFLLRHAKAASPDEAGDDRDRPLEERGRQDARAIGQAMAHRDAVPDLVLCSPALRTRQTLEAIAAVLPDRFETSFEEPLYLADAALLLNRLRHVPHGVRRALVIGHNPGLHELGLTLNETGAGPLVQRLALGFPTAALARFELLVDWPALGRRTARLIAFLTPKDL